MKGADPDSFYSVSADVIIRDCEWFDVTGFEDGDIEQHIRGVLFLVLNYAGFLKHIHEVEVAVLLTDDGELEQLNHEFRHKNGPTNVLSFPSHEFSRDDFSSLPIQEDEKFFLGDVAISYQRISQESIEQTKTFKAHFTHILVHSFLHLLGYDHVEESDAEIMERVEISIMNSMGFKDPYLLEHVADTLQIKY
ncbi:MAG: rRNA maturation RNase YbeY [Candidatus Midichloria mitochondrii]|uniref:Endoribonuclease YbeY n=1 Tax=Midichloria mitochondrii (strain IricVA) TaxID=696127 RepID=F7XVY1_MIDMI|nr:rRNA maturation RNase YbeY [Candidatus Midichloria mitochondrii]AEI88830.1 putative metalloprotease [Candidatus Midichloria mitochondrii IricVA]MDJ1256484.1 rRNA maturation RNase YbeY [Candidatus Midichloria mitochondrii]MDJ1288199.1 rRNA maturation RNase YbeY [Candidatus Midichloria mitochondrii]MDJ1299075.1 rRNA maturation RNase YbeY [Candidatus Midichloria mitochondrii]MDJ1312982.1 rRNA maturation RNase YbeY [Candidatus Midichloria mitochondrii]